MKAQNKCFPLILCERNKWLQLEYFSFLFFFLGIFEIQLNFDIIVDRINLCAHIGFMCIHMLSFWLSTFLLVLLLLHVPERMWSVFCCCCCMCPDYFIRQYFTLHLYRLSNFTCIGVTFLHTLFLYFTCKIMKKSWFQFISCCWTRKKRIFRQDCSTIFAQHA